MIIAPFLRKHSLARESPRFESGCGSFVVLNVAWAAGRSVGL